MSKAPVTLARSASAPAAAGKKPGKAKSAKPVAATPTVAPVAPLPSMTAIRPRSFPDDARILVLAEANPKRDGTKAFLKWSAYKGAATVADFVKAFTKLRDPKTGMPFPKRRAYSALRWDSGHGFVAIGADAIAKATAARAKAKADADADARLAAAAAAKAKGKAA